MGSRIKIKFLVENKTDKQGIMAEHGLSIYIEACGKKILFDAGATDLIVRNAEKMNVDLSDVDFAVVSHGHYDHTGGFPAFCRINDSAPIYIHKNAFRVAYEVHDGKLDDITTGIRWSDDERAAISERLVFTDGPLMIGDDICITGTLPPEEGFVPTEVFLYKGENGEFEEDDMSHEQCLVIRREEGLYVFSGCSHRGVIAALNCAKTVFPGEKIALLAAGMHLYKLKDEERKQIIDKVSQIEPSCVMPVHCTGIKGICDLKASMGDRCVVATAGDSYDGC